MQHGENSCNESTVYNIPSVFVKENKESSLFFFLFHLFCLFSSTISDVEIVFNKPQANFLGLGLWLGVRVKNGGTLGLMLSHHWLIFVIDKHIRSEIWPTISVLQSSTLDVCTKNDYIVVSLSFKHFPCSTVQESKCHYPQVVILLSFMVCV